MSNCRIPKIVESYAGIRAATRRTMDSAKIMVLRSLLIENLIICS